MKAGEANPCRLGDGAAPPADLAEEARRGGPLVVTPEGLGPAEEGRGVGRLRLA